MIEEKARDSTKKNEDHRKTDGQIEIMNESNTALIVMDVQEKLINNIQDKDYIVWNIQKLINAANILNIRIYITEQSPAKLGDTITSIKDIFNGKTESKVEFSCVNCQIIKEILKEDSISNILLCGVETHICIQQSAIDLNNKGFNVFLAIDSVGSRNIVDHKMSIKRLSHSSINLTSSESAIFEWCKTSDRAEFKAISKLVKEKYKQL